MKREMSVVPDVVYCPKCGAIYDLIIFRLRSDFKKIGYHCPVCKVHLKSVKKRKYK